MAFLGEGYPSLTVNISPKEPLEKSRQKLSTLDAAKPKGVSFCRRNNSPRSSKTVAHAPDLGEDINT